MIELKKDEFVYLMAVRRQNKMGIDTDYDVIPFKTANDVKNAILNIIANNIKNNRDYIRCISYDGIGGSDCLAVARIEYTSYKSNTYKAVRRRINEIK